MMSLQNPFDDTKTAAKYESWYQTAGSRADHQEKALLKWLLKRFLGANSVLEVGCGTGHFSRWFSQNRLQVVGLDRSSSMLHEAKRLKGLPDYLKGDALRLPFPSCSFDLTVMITALEFLPDPEQSLAEAFRVARYGMILGVLNAQSRLGRKYKQKGGPVWGAAKFYTPGELKQMILGFSRERVGIVFRTTLLPFFPGSSPLPWGGFIGMGVIKLSKGEEKDG